MAPVNSPAASPASRKIRRLAVAVAVVVALYSAGWYFVASRFKSCLQSLTVDGNALTIRCPGLATSGFPFLIGFTCSKTDIADRTTGNAISAGAVRAAARIYSPGTAVVELDSPAEISLSDGSAISATWKQMRSSVSASLSSLRSFSATGEEIKLDVMAASLYEALAIEARHGELHFRGNDGDLEAAILARDFAIGSERGQSILPTLSTSAELTLDGKAALLEGRPLLSKAMTGTVTSFKIEMPDGLYGELDGPFEIDDEGYVSGRFKTRLEKLDLWEKHLLGIFPDARNTISGLAALLKGLAKGGDDVTVNLVVDRGRITLSMFPLGQIPPI